MRKCGLFLCLFLCFSVHAEDSQRNVVGNLTSSAKPQIKTMSYRERVVASENMLALNLDAAPEEIVCRKVKVGRDSASKLKVQRCKSRAQFREEAEQRINAASKTIDDSKYRYHNRIQIRRSQQPRTK